MPVCPEVLGGLDILGPRAERRGQRALTETGQDVSHVLWRAPRKRGSFPKNMDAM